jgi:hypothetical protein
VLLIIDAELTAPPSETTLFRDITLYATIFKGNEVVVESSPQMQDFYYKWLKSAGAFDFVKDIVDYEKEQGFTIRYKYSPLRGNIKIRSLGYHNFQRILTNL